MRISCIIPAINEAKNIRRCIERAWEAGFDEVIVVDGGSTDGTLESAQACRCRAIQSEPGRARQQNEGARCASGGVLYFQHADNWLAADGARQISQAMENPDQICGAFYQRIDAAGWKYRWLERGNAARVAWLGSPYGDQGIFVRRRDFEAAGGFPEEPILEELLLMRKLRKRAWPILLPGPLHINARRWQANGVLRQTLRNWRILTLHALGRTPKQLVGDYPRHDARSSIASPKVK